MAKRHFRLSGRCTVLTALAHCLATVLVSGSAAAYRTTAELAEFDGISASWPRSPIGYFVRSNGAPDNSLELVRDVVARAAQIWESPVCSGARFQNLGVQTTPAQPGDDRNSIEWIQDWTARGFDANAAGVTDVQYAQDGEGGWRIVEADIYLNAEGFTWRLDGPTSEPSQRSILAALTHEFGHVLGLRHSCEDGGADGAPNCAKHPEAVAATMYPYYNPAQVSLSSDDEAGVCFLYPAAAACGSDCDGSEGVVCEQNTCARPCAPACGEQQACRGGECVDLITGGAGGSPDGAEPDPPGGSGIFGDLCSDASHCASGLCVESACSSSCRDDEDCPAAASCRHGACVSPMGGLGAACSEANECLGNQCLRIDGRAPTCTRECLSDRDCSLDWSCQTLAKRRVCAPPGADQATGGCSVGGRTGRRAHDWAFLLLPLTIAVGLKRVRQRRQRTARRRHVRLT